MNAMTLNKKVCGLPVINLSTGSVISHGFTPMFSSDTLKLSSLETESAYGTPFSIPASAISFVNDVCVMVRADGVQAVRDTGLCRLIGEPLTAKAGPFSLFGFGEIVSAEVSENGSVRSLTLQDGQSFDIPENGETVITPDFRFSPAAAPEPVRDSKPVTEPEPAPAPGISFPEETEQPVKDETPQEEKVPEKKKKGTKAFRIDWRDLCRRYAPPLIAMAIYFILYFIAAMKLNIIK